MRWTSALAIFFLLWVTAAIFVLPFEARGGTHHHDHERIPGQADSAPRDFRPKRVFKRATILGLIFFAAFYINYVNDWITPQDIDFLYPASSTESTGN